MSAFVGAVELSDSDNTSPSIGLPAGWAAGDLALMVLTVDGSSSDLALPPEFSPVYVGDVPSSAVGAIRIAIGTRILAPGDSSFTASQSPGFSFAHSVTVWRGRSTVQPIDAGPSINPQPSAAFDLPPALSIDTITPDTAVISIVSQARGAAFSSMDWDDFYQPPSGTTEVVDVNTYAGTGYAGHAVGYEMKGAPGPTGDRTWGSIFSYGGLGVLLALRTPRPSHSGSGNLKAERAELQGQAARMYYASGDLRASRAGFSAESARQVKGSVELKAAPAKASMEVDLGRYDLDLALAAGRPRLRAYTRVIRSPQHIASTFIADYGSSVLEVDVPEGASERDVLFAVITAHSRNAELTLPSGFTVLFNGRVPNSAVGDNRIAYGYRILTSDMQGELLFTKPPDNAGAASLSLIRYANRDDLLYGDPIHVAADSASLPMPANAGVDATEGYALVFNIVSQGRGPLFGDMVWEDFYQPPPEMTEVVDVSDNAGSGYAGFALGYESVREAGETEERQWGTIFTSGGLAITIGFRPDAGPKMVHTANGELNAQGGTVSGIGRQMEFGVSGRFQAGRAKVTAEVKAYKIATGSLKAEPAKVNADIEHVNFPRLASGALKASQAGPKFTMDNKTLEVGDYQMEFYRYGQLTQTAHLTMHQALRGGTRVNTDLVAGPAKVSLTMKRTSNAVAHLKAEPAKVVTYPWIEHHPEDSEWVQHDTFWNE